MYSIKPKNKRRSTLLLKYSLGLPCLLITLTTQTVFADLSLPANILRIEANMAVDTPEQILNIVDQGVDAGATAILMNDSKATRWGAGEPQQRWLERMKTVANGIKDRALDLGFNTITLGFCSSLASADPNLVTGYPVVNQPMRAAAGKLYPMSTASITNGGFEDHQNNQPIGFDLQDAPGERTFIDGSVSYIGDYSLRADAKDNEMSRIQTTFDVEPNKQHLLVVWLKTEALSARNVMVIIRDADTKKLLTTQWPSLPQDNGKRNYIRKVNNLTTDWTKQKLTFNTQGSTRVSVMLAVFGGTQGSIWWDNLHVRNKPLMNWLRRDDLPTTVTDSNGIALTENEDLAPVIDPNLGNITFPGSYDTYHKTGKISTIPTGKINNGNIVYLSGYHTQVTGRGQVGCSWHNPKVGELVSQVHERLTSEFNPDFYHYNQSEVRTGGAEPLDKQYMSAGAAFAAATADHIQRIQAAGGDADILLWSDMHDPLHNAKEDYYQIASSMENSWEGIDPSSVIIANWWSGSKLRDKAGASLQHFDDLGFKQIIAGYYEEDVEDNFEAWQNAASGIKGIAGSMFYTNFDGYQDLAEFGEYWWQ